MIKIKTLGLLLITLFFINSCDKNKRYSRRIDDDKWKVTKLTVDGNEQDSLPVIKFNFCDIYEETCEGSWTSADGKAKLAWQFRDKGKTFEISNQTDHGHDLADVKAAEHCINYTGVYEVVKSKRKYLEIKSLRTYGYNNKVVLMILEKQ